MPRPSLSVDKIEVAVPEETVSPGLMPRPSLSGDVRAGNLRGFSSVAGVDAPAFVERADNTLYQYFWSQVSPGLMPRPSLSVLT